MNLSDRKQPLLAAAFVTAAICAIGFLLSGSIFVASMTVLFGVLVFLTTRAVMTRHREALLQRSAVNRATPDFTWEVIVNGVNVGAVSDRELAQIQLSVANDWRTVTRQAQSFLNAASIAIDRMLQVIPAALFWVAFAYAIVDIEGFTALVQSVRDQAIHNPARLIALLGQLFLSAAMLTITLMVIFLHASFGARNVARDDVIDQLRLKLRVAARGELRLLRTNRHGDATQCEYADPFDWFSSLGRSRRRAVE